jgi:hypothetical protein
LLLVQIVYKLSIEELKYFLSVNATDLEKYIITARPYFICNHVPKEELKTYECSDRILLCRNFFTKVSFPQGAILLKLSNSLDESISGVVFNLHDDENVVYVPNWMYYSMQIVDNISVSQISIQRCTKILIQPTTPALQTITDWEPKLNKAFLGYNSLTVDARIPLLVDDVMYFVNIKGLSPKQYTTVFVQNGGDVELEIADPLVKEPMEENDDPKVPFFFIRGWMHKKRKQTLLEQFHAFEGFGRVVGGSHGDPNETSTHKCATAAVRRIEIAARRGMQPREDEKK